MTSLLIVTACADAEPPLALGNAVGTRTFPKQTPDRFVNALFVNALLN